MLIRGDSSMLSSSLGQKEPIFTIHPPMGKTVPRTRHADLCASSPHRFNRSRVLVFCREMEEGLYNKYYNGWSRDLVRPCDPEDYRKLFDRAFGTDKSTTNWIILCLRQGLPFNMGSKAETFPVEDFKYNVTEQVLRLFLEYKVPVIFETKSHFLGLERYLDIIRELHCAVIVAIMGGTDTLN